MTFRSDFRKSGDRARRGGGGGRGGIAVGGGIGGLLMVGLFRLLGGDPSQLQQPSQQGGGQRPTPQGMDHCQTGEDANNNVDCRIEFTGISVDRVWEEQLPAQAGIA